MKKLLASFFLSFSPLLLAWDLGLYMQADNDLASYAFKDLTELSNGLMSNPAHNIYIELDLPGSSGFKRIKLLPKKMETVGKNLSDYNYELLGTASEETSQKDRLLTFLIEWGETSPSEEKMLVIWGHGEGFGAGKTPQFGGVAIDENPMRRMEISEIADALKTYKSIFNQEIQISTFDACLMQTLEVVYELKDYTPYVIGSTQIQNFDGLPYDTLLSLMSIVDEPSRLATEIPLLVERERQQDTSQMTMSSVNTRELYEVFLPHLNRTLSSILDRMEQKPFLKLELLDHFSTIPQFLGESRDLNTVLSYLGEFFYDRDGQLFNQIGESRLMFSRSLLSYTYGDFYIRSEDYHLGAFKAFGLWFPVDGFQYEVRRSDFITSRFYLDNPLWSQFLAELFENSLF